MALQKAEITPKTGSNKTALVCAFNPHEVTLSSGASWEHKPIRSAASAPPAQFGGTTPRKLGMTLWFDQNWPAYKGRKVEDDIQRLIDWTCPTSDSRRGNEPNPPTLRFSWGTAKFANFSAVLDSVSVTFSLFSEQGVPLRAKATVAFTEVPDEPGPQNPSSGGRAGRRTHVLRAGDSLHSIAQREYGKPAYWRGLAAANGLDDPMRVPVGTTILVPPAEDAEELS